MSNWLSLFELWPTRIDGPAFLTTFNFDPAFFELRLLPELLRRGASPVVVLLDRDEGLGPAVDMLARLEGAGRDYYLLPVALPGKRCFHPKVHYFPRRGVGVVGSGNLTPGGAGRNLEVVDVLTHERVPGATARVSAFFRRLLEDPALGLDAVDRDDLLRHLPDASPADDPDVRFLHTLDGALFPRLAEFLDGARFQEALLAAPFHDEDHATGLRLAQELGALEVSVAADAAGGWPGSLDARTGRLVEVLDQHKERVRTLHAKVVGAAGPDGAMVLTGSANLTAAAWWAHNVEAVVVRRGDRTLFERLRAAIRLQPTKWEPPRPTKVHEGGLSPVPVRWARVDAGVLTVSMPLMAGAEFRITAGRAQRELDLLEEAGGYAGPIGPLGPNATLVHVSAPGHRSTVVVVHQPALLATTGRAGRIRRILQRIDAGLGEALDRKDLLASLADVLSAFQRVSPTPRSRLQERATAKGGAFHGDTDEAILDAITDIPDAAGMPELTRIEKRLGVIVNLLIGPSLGEAERSEDSYERHRAGTDGQKKQAKEQKDWKDDAYDEALRIGRAHLGKIREIGRDDPERAAVIHHTLVRLLRGLPRQFAYQNAILGQQCLDWMAEAWAVPEWPDRRVGWALEAGLLPEPQAELILTEAYTALAEDAAEAFRDLAHRTIAGLILSGGIEPRSDTAISLRAHETAASRARRVVEPLWELEAAWLARPRDAARFDRAARVCVGMADPLGERGGLYGRWRSARERGGRRVFPASPDGICPACNSLLSAIARSRLARNAHVEQCPCGVLLAHGCPEELDGR